ncbi:deoxyribose-phosphate aldolase [Hydrogenobacter thermophilus TK-6]|uniref:Deoxyribose-phosphate aldolase n=1 Tax=Hydrogenobacter thermophilus (strain DSM 6534 / IAM 12695 / TK-6) TaxID=608538 RepID=D3DHG9_HYDTT|nr:deoxyribose-phosphate aldolase [Hydrogenobacter thermophilus]ADO45208.1 deoxyribose-phosphate aldolase [Hydrogenobacter thermophilus TK-6]BAI69271.1 deoxyribose-phosphate aldolase [Hydrogenobacter thermophilus TK-6]
MDINSYIDHSVLKPSQTLRDLEEHIGRCIELGVYAVCVNPFWVKKATELSGGKLKVCSVISFPFGLDTKEQKVLQALRALEDGAHELDIVMNISAFKSGLTKYVAEELKAIGRHTKGYTRKLIIETAYLSHEEKKLALELAVDAGFEFVKTSTGYAPAGASEEDVKLLVELSKGRIKVKASGGIRTAEQAERFLKMGAERIGTSHTFSILKRE